MKKVIFFRPLFYIGGTEIATLNLIKKLKGYDIYIGYSDESSSPDILNEMSKYAKVINLNEKCDIEFDYLVACSLHFHLAEESNNIKRKKTYLWLHHFYNMKQSLIADKDKCMESLDGIITVSQSVTNRLLREYPYTEPLVKTIYNVIDDNEIIELSKEDCKLNLSKELNLVTVARIDMAKGFKRMLELAKVLKQRNVNFKWFVLGDSYYKEQALEIKKMFEPFKENFEWFGFVSNPHKVVRQCDYTVLLSDDETWGLVLTEAMILGVPCIATDFDTAFEQIDDKKNGIIFHKDKTEEFSERIDEIITEKERYKKSLENFKYGNKNIIKQWDNIFDNKNIKFSVIIPNYNKGIYIDDCINSVLNQTYKNFEVLFIDDESTDNSWEIINKYKDNKKLKLYKTGCRMQAGGARNIGIEKSKGDYIIFLDSDDYLTSNDVLEKLASQITDEDLIFLNYTKDNFGVIEEMIEEEEAINEKIAHTRNLGCPTKCFKKELIEDIKFPVNKRFEDIVFGLEAMCKTKKYGYFKDSFFTYRRVKNSNATSEIDMETMINIFEEIFKIYRLCLKYPKYKLDLLKRIKHDKLDVRLKVLDDFVEFNKNTFKDYFY